MIESKYVSGVMLFAGLTVVGNAIESNQFCIGHPLSFACENPVALSSDFPHESPEPTPGPAPSALAVNAATSVTGTTLGVPLYATPYWRT